MQTTTLTLAEATTAYVRSKKLSTREKTRDHYTYINRLCNQAAEFTKLADLSVAFITNTNIEEIIDILGNSRYFPNLSETTIQKCFKFHKSTFAWLMRNRYIDSDPMLGLKFRRVHPRETLPFTESEIHALLNVTPVLATDFRDLAIILALLDCGIRREEICNLNRTDWNGNRLQIKGKGGKHRTISLGNCAIIALKNYVENHRTVHGEDFLFLTEDGHQMQPRLINKRIEVWGKKAGVDNCAPHRFRATFATRFVLQHGGNLVMLQALLGHSTIDMSRHYVKLAKAEEARLLNSTSSVVDALVEKEEKQKPTSIVTTAATLPVDVLSSTPILPPDAAAMQQFTAMMGGMMGAAMAMFQAMQQGSAPSPEALTSFLSAGEGK